jgi:hypothetical protein
MNRAIGVLGMHAKDKKRWLYLPWAIVGASFAINLIIAGFAPEPFTSGGVVSLFIYMMVTSIISVAQTFPFSLGFGVRRKDYYLGSVLAQLVVSAVSAIILVILAQAEQAWTKGWFVGLRFFRLPYLADGTFLARAWTEFGILLFFITFGFFISSVFRKFGGFGVYALIFLVILLLTVSGYILNSMSLWDDLARELQRLAPTAPILSLWLLPFTIVFSLVSYLLLRRSGV